MATSTPVQRISKDKAIQLCVEVRRAHQQKGLSLARLRCWGCMALAKGKVDKMRFNQPPEYRGCAFINARYDQRKRPRR